MYGPLLFKTLSTEHALTPCKGSHPASQAGGKRHGCSPAGGAGASRGGPGRAPVRQAELGGRGTRRLLTGPVVACGSGEAWSPVASRSGHSHVYCVTNNLDPLEECPPIDGRHPREDIRLGDVTARIFSCGSVLGAEDQNWRSWSRNPGPSSVHEMPIRVTAFLLHGLFVSYCQQRSLVCTQ